MDIVHSGSLMLRKIMMALTDLSFPFLQEHVVLEVPESSAGSVYTADSSVDPCEALVGFSSLKECHRVILAESICHPRKVLYVGFLLLAPVLLLAFAFT